MKVAETGELLLGVEEYIDRWLKQDPPLGGTSCLTDRILGVATTRLMPRGLECDFGCREFNRELIRRLSLEREEYEQEEWDDD